MWPGQGQQQYYWQWAQQGLPGTYNPTPQNTDPTEWAMKAAQWAQQRQMQEHYFQQITQWQTHQQTPYSQAVSREQQAHQQTPYSQVQQSPHQQVQQAVQQPQQLNQQAFHQSQQKPQPLFQQQNQHPEQGLGNLSAPQQNFSPTQNLSAPQQNFPPTQNLSAPQQNFPPTQNLSAPQQNFPPTQPTIQPAMQLQDAARPSKSLFEEPSRGPGRFQGNPPHFHPRGDFGGPRMQPPRQEFQPRGSPQSDFRFHGSRVQGGGLSQRLRPMGPGAFEPHERGPSPHHRDMPEMPPQHPPGGKFPRGQENRRPGPPTEEMFGRDEEQGFSSDYFPPGGLGQKDLEEFGEEEDERRVQHKPENYQEGLYRDEQFKSSEKQETYLYGGKMERFKHETGGMSGGQEHEEWHYRQTASGPPRFDQQGHQRDYLERKGYEREYHSQQAYGDRKETVQDAESFKRPDSPRKDQATIPSLRKDPAVIPGLGGFENLAQPDTIKEGTGTSAGPDKESTPPTNQMIESLGKIVSQLQTLQGLTSSLQLLQTLPKGMQETVKGEGEAGKTREVENAAQQREKELSEETKRKVAALLASESDSDGEQSGKEKVAPESHETAPSDVDSSPPAREFDGTFDVKPQVYGTYATGDQYSREQQREEYRQDYREYRDARYPDYDYPPRSLPRDRPPGYDYPPDPSMESHYPSEHERKRLEPPPPPHPSETAVRFESRDYRHGRPLYGEREYEQERNYPPSQEHYRPPYSPPPQVREGDRYYESPPPPLQSDHERGRERERPPISSQIETIDYSHGASMPHVQSVDYHHGQQGDSLYHDRPPPQRVDYPPSRYDHPPDYPPPHPGYGPYPPYPPEGYLPMPQYPPPYGPQGGYFPPGFDPASFFAAYTGQGGEARRKTLPAWLREALEKLERDKQKKMEKEAKEAARKESSSGRPTWRDELEMEEEKEQEKEELAGKTRSFRSYPYSRSRSPGDKSDDEELGPPPQRRRRQEAQQEEEPEDEEEKQINMIMKIRKMLTEILLEVTDQEIEDVANEEFEEAKKPKLTFQVKGPQKLPSQENVLGLNMYESGSEGSEEEMQRKTAGPALDLQAIADGVRDSREEGEKEREKPRESQREKEKGREKEKKKVKEKSSSRKESERRSSDDKSREKEKEKERDKDRNSSRKKASNSRSKEREKGKESPKTPSASTKHSFSSGSMSHSARKGSPSSSHKNKTSSSSKHTPSHSRSPPRSSSSKSTGSKEGKGNSDTPTRRSSAKAGKGSPKTKSSHRTLSPSPSTSRKHSGYRRSRSRSSSPPTTKEKRARNRSRSRSRSKSLSPNRSRYSKWSRSSPPSSRLSAKSYKSKFQ